MADDKSGGNAGGVNILERAIATIAPTWALERARSRSMLHHFGWDSTQTTTARGSSGGMWRNAAAESPRMNTDRIKLMWEVRDLERQFGFVSGLLARVSDYTCHKISFKARTGDNDTNKAYEDYFHDWCGRADYSGRHRFVTLARLALRSMLRDGDFGFIKRDVGGELRLQGIEADRIGNPQEASGTDEQKIGGIILGENGEPAAYQIFKRGRTSTSYTHQEDVDPRLFIHLWNPFRHDQYRGVTWFHNAIPRLRDLYECFSYEMQAAKFASSFAGFVYDENSDPTTGPAAWDTNGDASQSLPNTYKAQSGTVQRLTGNQRVTFAPPTSRPSGAFLTLIESYLREVAASLNLPFGFVYDMARFGGVTARLETQQAQRAFQGFQEILVNLFLDNVKNAVLMRGIAAGKIPPHPKWKSGGWLFGAWLTADIGHETSADIELLNAGLTSETRLIEKYGADADELVHEQGTDIQRRVLVTQATGTPIELQSLRLPAATQLLAAKNVGDSGEDLEDPALGGAPADPGPPPGLVGEQGEKGVKPLIEILKNVSLGKMDRESAIAALMHLYALDRLTAEQMVPAVARAAMTNAE